MGDFVRICYVDDEDTNDYQPSPVPKTAEHERFAKDKEVFKRKYKEQIDQVFVNIDFCFFCGILNLILVKISLANTSK